MSLPGPCTRQFADARGGRSSLRHEVLTEICDSHRSGSGNDGERLDTDRSVPGSNQIPVGAEDDIKAVGRLMDDDLGRHQLWNNEVTRHGRNLTGSAENEYGRRHMPAELGRIPALTRLVRTGHHRRCGQTEPRDSHLLSGVRQPRMCGSLDLDADVWSSMDKALPPMLAAASEFIDDEPGSPRQRDHRSTHVDRL